MSTVSASAVSPENWANPGMEFLVHKDQWYACSVGYPATDKQNKHYFITAGHCFRSKDGKKHYFKDKKLNLGAEIFDPADSDEPIGFEKLYSSSHDNRWIDISLVEMYADKKLHGKRFQPIPISPHRGVPGEVACMIGFKQNKPSCGVIMDTQVTGKSVGSLLEETDLTVAKYCSLPGDSGGAVFNDSAALGIEVVGSTNCRSAFIPILDVLAAFRVHIPHLTLI